MFVPQTERSELWILNLEHMAALAEECMCYTLLQERPCVLNIVTIILSALFAEQIQGDFQVLNS